jgi:hypothetical protein
LALDLSPGPGQYFGVEPLIGGPSSIKYTMGLKNQDPMTSANPGPGSYNPRDELTHERSPERAFSQMQRPDVVGKEALSRPGPGTYDLDNDK